MKKKAINPSAMSMDNSCSSVDNLPAGLRGCVHEFGWSVVRAFLDHNIREPSTIRHLVHVAWAGPKEASNRQPAGSPVNSSIHALDEFLIRSEAKPTARALIGLFYKQGLALLPREPTDAMIGSSGVSREKLRVAVRAAERAMWPFLEEAGR